MKNIKPKAELNNIEKSALHAVKALVFISYPSKSKHISFEEAVIACKLNPNEAEWLHIWLRAKGILNREYNNYANPDYEELKMAEKLFNISTNIWHLFKVTDIFRKMSENCYCGFESDTYFNLASEALL